MPKFSKKAKEGGGHIDHYPYQLVIVDADTPVFRASKLVQEDYITVTHIKSGGAREFKNKTEFYGHWKKKEGGWLAETNKARVEEGKKPFPVEAFKIEEHVRLSDEIVNHVEEGVENFDRFIGGLKKQNLAPDYKLLIGGGGNFRYEVAETRPYKGNRPEKPLLFQEIKEAIITKYNTKIELVEGIEVDDRMAYYGQENQHIYEKEGDWEYCLAYVDKDLNMIWSPSINYDNFNAGVTIPTKLDCVKHYGKQLLTGDLSVDNIEGLPNLVNELREEYGVRKGSSLGDATAINYLSSCETTKEVFERVVWAYRAYYGEDMFEFTNYKGYSYQCDWLDRLQEVAILVYMNPLEEPLSYDIRTPLHEFGVKYD